MPALTRGIRFILILAAGIFWCSSQFASAQTPEKKAATGSISGRVTVGGKAVEGVSVAAFGGGTSNPRVSAARTTTDSEGHYRLSGLLPAQYQVGTLTPNLTTAEQGSQSFYGIVSFGASKSIVVAAGEEVEDIDLKLVRGAVITGRVTDADNKPVIEERVSLQLVDENGNPSRTGLPPTYNFQMYQTDDRGIYRIYGLPAGRYRVSVGTESSGGLASNRRGYYPRTFYPDTADQAKANIVELTEGGEATNIDIQVGRRAETYSAAGHVVDSETGQPISGARLGYLVASQNPERFSSSYSGPATDSRGEFRIDGLRPGRYGVYVTRDFEYDGGDVYSDPVYFEVVDNNVSGLEVKAIHGLSISGVVFGDVEMQKDLLAQLPGLRILATVTSGSRAQTYTNGSSPVQADGSFQINGLRPGRASIGVYTGPSGKRPSITRIEHDGIGITQGFELQPGQSISGLRVVISYGTGVIRGTVRFEGGTPPAGSQTFVRCNREGARDGTGAQLDARGHFVISGLAPGTYEVTLQTGFVIRVPPGQRPQPPQKQVVTVTNDAEAQVTFVVDLTPKEGAP